MKRILAIWVSACLLIMGLAALAEDSDGAVLLPDLTVEAGAEAATGEDAQEAGEAASDEATPAPEASATDAAVPADAETPAPAEKARFTLWFEEGFGLDIPEGWVSYPLSDADRRSGLRYCLGEANGARLLYIHAQPAPEGGLDAVSGMIENSETLEKTGDLTFGSRPFEAFIDAGQNISGCAMIWGDQVVSFLFTPQTDSDYMLQAIEIMETFAVPD